MPFNLLWLVQDRIILVEFIGDMSNDDVVEYLNKSFDMRDEANERLGEHGPFVHTITDATRFTRQDFRMKDIQNMLSTLRSQRVGWSIFVHPNILQRFMSAMGQQVVGVRHKEVDTVEEAMAFLQANDETLPPIPHPNEVER